MRKRMPIVAGFVLMASTTQISQALAGNTPEILVYERTEQPKPKLRVTKFAVWFYNKYGHSPYDFDARKQHKFIERFLPRNEQALDSTINFLREKRRSKKLLRRKPPVGAEALKVA